MSRSLPGAWLRAGVTSWRCARDLLRAAYPNRCARRSGHVLAAALVVLMQSAGADCRLELELMSADLRGVKLTEAQAHELAAMVDEVLKRCRMGWEESALEYIAKARAVAHIPKRDWLAEEPSPRATEPPR